MPKELPSFQPEQPLHGGHSNGPEWFSREYRNARETYEHMGSHNVESLVESHTREREIREQFGVKCSGNPFDRSDRDARHLAAIDVARERRLGAQRR